MNITNIHIVEHFKSADGKQAVSLRFYTGHSTKDYKMFGADFALPMDGNDIAEVLRKVANDLQGVK